MSLEPYYEDDFVQLYKGDCREVTAWLDADVLVTDPPYGIAWRGVSNYAATGNSRKTEPKWVDGIANDENAAARDDVLKMWGSRPAIVFGALRMPVPEATRHIAIYVKPLDTGVQAALAGLRRDIEAIYLLGHAPEWKRGSAARFRSSVFQTSARVAGTPVGLAARHGHPHAKPLDVLEDLLAICPPGTIADPFAGSGSTLVAAKALGRKAIGVELEERYCEIAAKRLAQDVLDFGGVA